MRVSQRVIAWIEVVIEITQTQAHGLPMVTCLELLNPMAIRICPYARGGKNCDD